MESKIGSLLSLIGGILWLVIAIVLIVISLVSVIASSTSESAGGLIFGAIFLGVGVLCIVFGTLAVKGSQWMKEESKVKKGGITSLIAGILSLNLLAIIGGILGLVDSGK